jgi:ABC-type transport system involved in cytochrome bd biosynthesis fused ATPase/permease subunit
MARIMHVSGVGRGKYFLDLLRGLPTLEAIGRTEAGRAKVEEVSDQFGARTLAVLRVAFVSGLALEFIATVSVALVAVLLAVLLAVRLLVGDLSGGRRPATQPARNSTGGYLTRPS